MARTHIIGAGLSGLSAAVRVAERGGRVSVYDSAGQAGGRCRSFFDKHLERDIDNGNHLIMSGNKSALDFLKIIGSDDPLVGPPFATYPFVDVATGARWTVRLNEGPIPFWVLDKKWRVPDTGVMDYVRAAAIAVASDDKTVADVVDTKSPLYKMFWEPLTLAVLNTTPEIGQAKLLWSVIRETFLLGGLASTPLVARQGLGPAFVDPAVRFIEENGGDVKFGARLRDIRFGDRRVDALGFGDQAVEIGADDNVILALPPTRLKQVMPEYDPPTDDASILNVHYRVGGGGLTKALGENPFIAMVSSLGQWAFVRDDVVSITTSASNVIGTDEKPNDDIVSQIWRETQIALDLGDRDFERVRVIHEKRATPDQSPASAKKRLNAETRYQNLFLAGDHTDTDVPATIEGSIRSGAKAAGLAIARNGAAA